MPGGTDAQRDIAVGGGRRYKTRLAAREKRPPDFGAGNASGSKLPPWTRGLGVPRMESYPAPADSQTPVRHFWARPPPKLTTLAIRAEAESR